LSNSEIFDENYKFGTREVWELDTALTTSIIVPMSPGQYDVVERAAADTGLTVEQFIRQGIGLAFSLGGTYKFEDGARDRKIKEKKKEFKRRGCDSAFAELTEAFNLRHSKLVKVPVSERAKAEYEWGKERYIFNTYVEFQMALKGIGSRVFWADRGLMDDWHDNSM